MTQIVIIQFLTFGVLLFILFKVFSDQFGSAMKRLRAIEEETQSREAQINEELSRAQRERDAEVEKGRVEARVLIEKAKKEIEVMRLKAEDKAKRDSQIMLSYGKEELDRLRRELLNDADTQAVRYAMEIMRYVLTDKAMENFQHQFIENVIAEVESLDKSQFSVKVGSGKIVSGFALNERELNRLQDAVAGKMDNQVVLEQETRPELIAGMIIYLGEMIIDASLKNKLEKAIPHLSKI